MQPSNQQAHAAPAVLRVLCPHCKEPIDVSNVVAFPNTSNTQAVPETPSPFLMLGRASSRVFVKYLFPVRSAFGPSKAADDAEDKASWSTLVRNHWKLCMVFVASIVAICLLLVFWGMPQAVGIDKVASTATIDPSSTALALPVNQATKTALLDTLSQYNRAETEAAALLTFSPLQSLLVSDGPLARRRVAQIVERKKRQAPHRTMLVRWAVGEVTMVDTTATVVTQETWSNQEANTVAPEQATVRVTYTLHWDETKQRWLILDSSQMPL